METRIETSPQTPTTEPQHPTAPELPGSANIGAAIDAAGGKAVREHVQERNRGGRPKGRRDSQPRKPRNGIPLAQVDDFSGSPLLGEDETNVVQMDFETDPALDDKFYETLAEGLAGGFEDVLKLVAKTAIARDGGDKQAQDEVVQQCVMSERNRKLLVIGGTGCLKKYLRTQHGPEAMAAFGAGLHLVAVLSVVKAGKSELKKVREKSA